MNKKRRAFTLFELMIVVVIIGIVYSLVLGRFDTKQYMKITKLDSLREILRAKHQEGVRVDLYLYDNCKKSALFLNSTYQEDMKINIKPEMFKNLKVYKSDQFGNERQISFAPVIIEDKLYKVCFKFTIFPNGSSSNYIVEQNEHYYIFPPYFEDVNQTQSLQEALSLFTHKDQKRISSYE